MKLFCLTISEIKSKKVKTKASFFLNIRIFLSEDKLKKKTAVTIIKMSGTLLLAMLV